MQVNVSPFGRQGKFAASLGESFNASGIGYAYLDRDSLPADSLATLSAYGDGFELGADSTSLDAGSANLDGNNLAASRFSALSPADVGTGLGDDLTLVNFDPEPFATTVVNLATLPASRGFRIAGGTSLIGISGVGSGDTNGDGIADLIIGAFDENSNAGAAYVVYGRSGLSGTVTLSSLSASAGFRIAGAAASSFGLSATGIGDVNGDGLADFAVGGNGSNTTLTGEIAIIFGRTGGYTNFNVSSLTSATGIRIFGATNETLTQVARIGDFNGDGRPDFVIGATQGPISGAGGAYVIFGTASGQFPTSINLASLGSAGVRINGAAAGDNSGWVSAAGDFNRDGLADFVIGAPLNDAGGLNAGAAYVVYGRAGTATINLASLGTGGLTIIGDRAGDGTGGTLGGGFDFNGDGWTDIIVNGQRTYNGRGFAYVVFGRSGGATSVDLTALNSASTDGFVLLGSTDIDQFGTKVSSAGDLNGDGFGDIIVSAPGDGHAPGNVYNGPGAIYVIYGRAGAPGPIDVTNLSPSQGFKLTGTGAYSGAGQAISSAGDVNFDGVNDIIVSADFNNFYVVYGVPSNTAPTVNANTGSTVLEGGTDTIASTELDFNDAQQADTAITYTVTTAVTNGSLFRSGVALVLNSTFTQADINSNLITYTHNGGETTSASFGFSVSDGAGGTVTGQTFNFTVTPVNDAPVNTFAATLIVSEDSVATPLTGISVTDSDNNGLLTYTLSVPRGALTLNTGVVGGITAAQITGGSNGSSTITVQATQTAINATLANGTGLTFSPFANFHGAVGLTVTASDGGATGTGGVQSDVDTRSITVTAQNDAPTVSGDGTEDALTILEDSPSAVGQTVNALFGGQYSDERDNQTSNGGANSASAFAGIAVVLNGSNASRGQWQYFNGASWVDIGAVSFTAARLFSSTTAIRFNPAPDYVGGAPTLTVRLIDSSLGIGITNGQVVDLFPGGVFATGGTSAYSNGNVELSGNVQPVNDAPVLDLGGNVVGYTENATGVAIAPTPVVIDIDSATMTSARIAISDSVAGDRLFVAGALPAGITVSGTSTDLVLILTGSASLAAYQTALGQIRYTSSSEDPTLLDSDNTRTVTVTVNDGTVDSNTTSIVVTLTSVNDEPTLTATALNPVLAENAGAADLFSTVAASTIEPGQTFASLRLTVSNVTDGASEILTFDGSPIALTNGNAVITATNGLNVTVSLSGTTATVGFTGATLSAAALQALVDGLGYRNSSENPTDANRVVTITQLVDSGSNAAPNDNVAAPGLVTTVNVNPVDDAPVAVADPTNPVNENATIAIDVRANDTDVDGGPLSVLSINGTAATVGVAISLASGATATLNADGTISYNPNGRFNTLVDVVTAAATGATNSSATDSFSYALNGGSSATVTVTVNGVAGAGDRLGGDGGNNIITGTPADDFFDLSAGGNDTVTGGNGNDAFFFGAVFTATDSVDGGAGSNDQIGLQGNYGAGLTLGVNSTRNVEVLAVLPGTGFNYNITTIDANVAAGQELVIFGGNLGATNNLTFNGSAETDGTFRVYGGLGVDNITTGAGNDGVYFGPNRFGATDFINAGAGTNDQVALDGTYTETISAARLQNVEVLALLRGIVGDLGQYNITLADDLIGAGQTFTVFGLAVETGFTLNAAAETNGNVSVIGGSGNETITTGAGADRIFGGGGADILNGGAGADAFVYDAVTQSTGVNYDRITGFVSGTDRFDFNFTVTGVDTSVGTGALSTASFDANLAAVIGAGQLAANHAVLFQASAGDLAGQSFLIVDANGVAGYQAGQDYVIQLITPPATLAVADFI